MRFLKLIIFTTVLVCSYSLKASEENTVKLFPDEDLDQFVLKELEKK